MLIERFERLNVASFRSFNWPLALPTFGGVNVVLGWNGSGKTVLSRIIRCLEKQSVFGLPKDSEFSVRIGGSRYGHENFGGFRNSIRVFNEDYIKEMMSQGSLPYVVYLGQDPVDYSELEKEIADLDEKRSKIVVEDKHTSVAKRVAEEIRLLDGIGNIAKELEPSGKYNAYNSSSFEKRIESLAKIDGVQAVDPDLSAHILDEQALRSLRQQLANQEAKDKEYAIVKKWDDWIEDKGESINSILSRIPTHVESRRISSHKSQSGVYGWIEQGVSLHKLADEKARHRACFFCNSTIGNRDELLKHFTDDILKMSGTLAVFLSEIEVALRELGESIAFYQEQSAALAGNINDIRDAIREKQEDMSKPVVGVCLIAALQGKDVAPKPLKDVAHQLERHYVAAAFKEYSDAKTLWGNNSRELEQAVNALKSKRSALAILKSKSKSVHLPAERLNELLKTTFPYKRIELVDSEDEIGYEVMRNGERCSISSLSEGERNFLALTYFLLSINTHEDSVKLADDGVVVIDDPVSSLDKNSVFQIFSVLARETERCKRRQYFFMTHNLEFYSHLSLFFKEDGANYYQVIFDENGSRLEEVHKMLRNFKSDYQYSVSLLWSKRQSCSPEDAYHVVNLLRRVWETFLHFKYGIGDYRNRLNQAYENALSEQVKRMGATVPEARVEQVRDEFYSNREAMYRFTNFASHDFVSTDAIDTSVLHDATKRIKDFFRVLELIDKDHHSSLTREC